MRLPHLTDDQIQEYLDGQVDNRKTISMHLESCESCREAVQGYRTLYKALAVQPAAEIMSEHTLKNLHQTVSRKQRSSALWEYILIAASIIVSVATSFYFFNPLPLLKQIGAKLGGTFTGFTDTISPHLMNVLPILLIAAVILILFDLADKRFIRSSMFNGK